MRLYHIVPLMYACGGSPSTVAVQPAPDDTTRTVSSSRAWPFAVSGLIANPQEIPSDSQQPPNSAPRSVQTREATALTLWNRSWLFEQRGDWNRAVEILEELEELDSAYRGLERRLSLVRMRRDRLAAVEALTPGSALPVAEEAIPGPRIMLTAVGDIQLGTGWPEDDAVLPPDQAAGIFQRVSELLGNADITFGNLETVLADSGESTKCRRGSRNCYAFRAPTKYAATLRSVGFDVMSINNNHAADFGDAGKRATENALDRVAIHHSGSSGVATWATQSLRLAMIAFSTGEGPYRVQDIESARAAVIAASLEYDLVLVSFHGGAEGSGATHVPKSVETAFGENRGDVFAFSRALVDAGADLVLGHGPHVLRGMEIYRGRLIAYSLGNFAAWHGFNLRGPLGLSAILNVTLAPNGVVTAARIDPVVIEQPGVPTPDPERRAVAIIRDLSLEDFGDNIFDEHGRFELEIGNQNLDFRNNLQSPISTLHSPIIEVSHVPPRPSRISRTPGRRHRWLDHASSPIGRHVAAERMAGSKEQSTGNAKRHG